MLDKVKSRLNSLNIGIRSSNVEVTLHLNAQDGPILDPEDLLSDALPDTGEKVYAVIGGSPTSSGPMQVDPSIAGNHEGQSVYGETIRVRIITPELARSQADVTATLALSGATLTGKSTLKELKTQLEHHIGPQRHARNASESLRNLRCNCSFANHIETDATLNEGWPSWNGSNALHTLIVVSGNNEITSISIEEPTQFSLNRVKLSYLAVGTAGSVVSFHGGLDDPHSKDENNTRYLKLPVLAVCSTGSHCETPDGTQNEDASGSSPTRRLVVDMHTSEMPIYITSHNCNASLAAAGLEDCMIDGVLNLYVIQRYAPESLRNADTRGKDSIYQRSLAWKHPLGSSERGLANFLSSLRVVAGLISAHKMNESEQDAVLRILMLLTKFPPAIRAMYILMRGEAPHELERAALVQCFYEVLKTVVPLGVVQGDPSRLLEGSCLLFGLILEKAKHLKVSTNSN